MSKILYNQMLVKACQIDYADGPISAEHTIIHTRGWDLHNLLNNLHHRAIVCMSMGDNGLYKADRFKIHRWFEKPIIEFDLPDNIVHLFCTHANVQHERVSGVPCGVMFSENSNVKFLEESEKFNLPKTNLMYVNFADTHPIRPYLKQIYSWAVEPAETELNLDYFLKMQRSKWVLCPPGHGPDSYRVWEALYAKSYPIVGHGCHHYYDLPILEADLNNLTREFLEEKYIEFSQREWNWSQLTEEYWIKHVQNKALSI